VIKPFSLFSNDHFIFVSVIICTLFFEIVMSIFLQLNQQFHKLIASAYEETENMKNVVSDMVKKNLQNIST
jgi:hypothetical protein